MPGESKKEDNEENSKETFENEFVTPANSRSGDEIVVPPKRNSNRKRKSSEKETVKEPKDRNRRSKNSARKSLDLQKQSCSKSTQTNPSSLQPSITPNVQQDVKLVSDETPQPSRKLVQSNIYHYIFKSEDIPLEKYPMNNSDIDSAGLALIFNFRNFDGNPKLKERKGTEKDVQNLKNLLYNKSLT